MINLLKNPFVQKFLYFHFPIKQRKWDLVDFLFSFFLCEVMMLRLSNQLNLTGGCEIGTVHPESTHSASLVPHF